MKKIGLLALAIVLSLGLAGVGLAQWTETLNINGDVTTGEADAMFRQGVSNDDGSVTPHFCINGAWMDDVDTGDTGPDPRACQTMGDPVARTDDAANTQVEGAWPQGGVYGSVPPLPADPDEYKQLTVTMSGVYPCYYATVFFSIVNAGTIPCKVDKIELVKVSGEGDEWDIAPIELTVCTWYCVSIDGDTATIVAVAGPESCPECTDFSFHLSDNAKSLYDVMGTYAQPVDTAAGDLCIHVNECAEELAEYDFTIRITVIQAVP